MKIKSFTDVPAQPVTMEGAKNVSVRVLIGPKDDAPTFAMRLFELAPGGHTPYHEHTFEHEVYVVSGSLAAVTPDGPIPLTPGQVLLIDPNETHQFKNTSDTDPAAFLCLVPIQHQP